ncbi:hypothetical protein LPN01_10705 [Sphingomonas sp. A2-49]|uniref:hypothetical protein n=1 Tax=Sphingomonas sp. A2-49 TaxID=1391375 RepID=UPI0021D1908C|nr:hypothetical protein [Sphingomonas sp. A2-49]MCU6454546.1 hypothetical protein [Sphingomonas sp. A2-49]
MIALLIALLSPGACPPPSAAGQAVPTAIRADASVTAQLDWPQGTDIRAEANEGEIVVRFDRPLRDAAIDAFRVAAGAAIGDLRWNDDSLVLRAAPGWTMTWQRSGSRLAVAFAPLPATAVPVADDAAIVAVEADAAAGYPGRARRAATRLAAGAPTDPRIMRLLADAQAADGDGRAAADGYRALAADDRAARRIRAAAPGTASAGVTLRDGSDLSQAEASARVDVAIDDRLAVGGGVRRLQTRVDGRGRHGATVADASVAARLDAGVRLQLIASAALDTAVTGGGARLVAGPAEAQLRVTLLRHMPDYSTAAQVLAGGYLSRALVGVTYRLTPGVVVQADAGGQRYGIAGQPGATDTIVASAGVDYLIRRQFPALGLTYRYEAEYVQRMRSGGDALPIVPLATRENHTLQGLVSGAAGEVQLTALAGWTVDRFGGDGPTASVGIAAPIGIGWRVEGSGGVTSIARAGFSGRQLFARAQLTRNLGDGR